MIETVFTVFWRIVWRLPFRIIMLSLLKIITIPTNMIFVPHLLEKVLDTKNANLMTTERRKEFIIGLCIVFLGRGILDFTSSILNSYIKPEMEKQIRNMFFQKIQSISFENFEKLSPSRLSDLLDRSSAKLMKVFDLFVNKILPAIFFAFCVFYVNGSKSYKLLIVSILWLFLHFGFALLVGRITSKYWRNIARIRNMNNQSINNIFRNKIVESFFGLENLNFTKFSQINEEEKQHNKKVNLISALLLFLKDLNIIAIQQIGFTVLLLNLLKSGEITMGGFASLFQINRSFAMFFNHIAEHVSEFFEEKNKAELFNEILFVPNKKVGDLSIIKQSGSIKLNNVSFSFGEKKIFDHFSFFFEAGKKVSITGVSGIGKTTFFLLLCGLMESYTGDIFIDNINIRFLQNKSEVISFVTANNELYDNFSLDENITLGRDFSKERLEEIKKICLIDHLENRLYFSTGEKKRIMIARGLLNSFQTKILLLDEPLTNLDQKTKELIFQNIMELTKGKTCFFIDHSHEFVKHTDMVIFFSKNSIIVGNHYFLIETNNEYKEFHQGTLSEKK